MLVILSRVGSRVALLAAGLAIVGSLWLALSPGLRSASNDAPALPSILISLNDRGGALIGDTKVANQDELFQLLKPYAVAIPQPRFVVRARAETPYEKIDWIRYALQRAGIVSISFATVPPQKEMLRLDLLPPVQLPSGYPRPQSASLRIEPGPIYYWNDEIVPDRKELTAKFETLGTTTLRTTTLGTTEGYGWPWLHVYLNGALPYKSAIEVVSEAKSLGIRLIFPELDKKTPAE